MFRKVTIALLVTAAVGMLAPDVVSARGGGGAHGGGMGGGFGGGMGGRGMDGRGMHMGGGIFRGGSDFGRGGFHATRFSGGRGFRTAGTSRLAKRTTARRVQCFTSDCSLWHSYSE